MIRLQFSRQSGTSSSLIAWFGKGEFSHVDCICPSGLLFGARSDNTPLPGVQAREPDYATFIKKVIFEIPSSHNQDILFYDFLMKQLGKPYDKWAILGFVTGRYWRENDSWICSELQAAALEYAGIVPKLCLATSKIDPVSLALTVSAIKGTTYHDV